MSDSLELESLFANTNIASDESMYEKVEWIELQDQQGGSYSTGQIAWVTDGMMTNHIVYSDSYLQLPMKVTFKVDPAGTNNTPPAKSRYARIAVKNSLLSLIQGIAITSGGGTVICNDQQSTPIINNLKLLLDSSIDFVEGNELHYCGKDTSLNNRDLAGDDKTIVGAVGSTISDAIPGIDAYKNQALANRITIFANRASDASAATTPATAQTQSFVAMIPLKFLHDFFKQMDFPIINLSLRITMNIAGVAGYKQYNPFTCPEFNAHYTLGAPSTALVPAAISSADLAALKTDLVAAAKTTPAIENVEVMTTWTSADGSVYPPKLMLKSVFYRAKEAGALADKIAKGFTKRIVFTTSNHYHSSQNSNLVDHPVVHGIIRPVRMWVFPLKAGTLKDADNTFPAAIGEYILQNTNIVLNGSNFYQNEFKNPYQYYKEFKSQCIGASTSTACGSPISYDDWIKGINPYVFDLSRNPTIRSNNQCNISLRTKVSTMSGSAATLPFDLEIVIEKLQTVDLHVSLGGVSVLIHQGIPE